jgi:hypothetical protein
MNKTIHKIGRTIEELILLAIGVYIGILVLFGDYWRFLNPKFKWLTGVTAVALIFTSTVALLNSNRHFRLSRILVFLLFLRLLTMGMSGSVSFVKAFQAGLTVRDYTDKRPSIVIHGREYVKINLAELYLLCEKKDPVKMGKSYVVRGIIRRSRALDSLGQVALIRTAVFCCLADAVAMGFRMSDNLQNDRGDGRMDELADGRWVEVYGKIESFPHKQPEARLHVQGLLPPVLSDSHCFVPDQIIPIKEPEIPYMFEFRKSEPYAY